AGLAGIDEDRSLAKRRNFQMVACAVELDERRETVHRVPEARDQHQEQNDRGGAGGAHGPARRCVGAHLSAGGPSTRLAAGAEARRQIVALCSVVTRSQLPGQWRRSAFSSSHLKSTAQICRPAFAASATNSGKRPGFTWSQRRTGKSV